MFRKSILWRLLGGLLLIFAVGSLFLYWMVQRQEQESRLDQIADDLTTLKANSQVYIRQLLVLDGQNNDERSYRLVAREMVQELYQINGCYPAAYTSEGELLYAVRSDLFESAPEEDFARAMAGTDAFTVFYLNEEQMTVTFSMPVEVVDETVGILRFWVDYSALYQQGRDTADMVLKSCMLVFALIFAVALILISQMLRPIRRLSRISRQVTEGLTREEIDPAVFENLERDQGPDEVGRLAQDMGTMLLLLDEQFDRMKEDKERILELMKSRQEFYNNVTHELKTPLTVIQGYAGLLETAGDDEELKSKAVTHIQNESGRLYRMVLQLLDLSRRRMAGKKEPVELRPLIASVAESMEVRASRYGIGFVRNLEEGLWVLAEEERVHQVIVNLFDNAIKYGREGCPVTVDGRRQDSQIVIEISNQGFLPPEDREKVFEPFYRISKEASREKGSAGLGLPLCRQLMEEQGGSIEADCRDGRVIFILTFTAAVSQQEQTGRRRKP